MTVDVVLLALATMIRPTSLAAVYALLSADAPRRLMMAYVIAGLAFTLAFGLLVVLALHGTSVHTGSDRTRGITELLGGVVVLGFGVLVARGRVAARNTGDAPELSSRWTERFGHRVTIPKAAIAGPATHVPGVFYVVALNVISSHHSNTADSVVEIVIYNAIWFALPIGALAICIVRPGAATELVQRVTSFAATHAHEILELTSFVAGSILIVRGSITI